MRGVHTAKVQQYWVSNSTACTFTYSCLSVAAALQATAGKQVHTAKCSQGHCSGICGSCSWYLRLHEYCSQHSILCWWRKHIQVHWSQVCLPYFPPFFPLVVAHAACSTQEFQTDSDCAVLLMWPCKELYNHYRLIVCCR